MVFRAIEKRNNNTSNNDSTYNTNNCNNRSCFWSWISSKRCRVISDSFCFHNAISI